VLVERYQGRVYRLALRVLRDEEAARDAAQDAFLKVHGALAKFEGRSGFYTWLYRLVLNLCLDIKRRDRSARHVPWADEREDGESVRGGRSGRRAAGRAGGLAFTGAASGSDPSADPAGVAAPRIAGPADAAERGELRGLIARAVEQLPEEARRTLLLREVDGLSYAEIATVLGVPKGTVMSRLHYARRRVQALLVEAGVESPDAAGSGPGGEGEDGGE
jgi:RNA polymerase sigma-70 factor (ECF subfamily)